MMSDAPAEGGRDGAGGRPSMGPPTPTDTALGVLTGIGEVLALQLLFVAASLPIVTALPAAAALQRSLYDRRSGHQGAYVSLFLGHFRWSTRRLWAAGLLLPLIYTIVVAAGLFWSGTATPLRWIGLGVVCAGAGLAGATYLAVLAASATSPASARGIALWRDSLASLFAKPLRLALATGLSGFWIVLAVRFPSLLLVGSGLAPAAIVAWVVLPGPVTRTRASSSRTSSPSRRAAGPPPFQVGPDPTPRSPASRMLHRPLLEGIGADVIRRTGADQDEAASPSKPSICQPLESSRTSRSGQDRCTPKPLAASSPAPATSAHTRTAASVSSPTAAEPGRASAIRIWLPEAAAAARSAS